MDLFSYADGGTYLKELRSNLVEGSRGKMGSCDAKRAVMMSRAVIMVIVICCHHGGKQKEKQDNNKYMLFVSHNKEIGTRHSLYY